MAAAIPSTQELIDQRLDALDRVLLGLLPRSERLAIVDDVEAKARLALEAHPELATASTSSDSALAGDISASTQRRTVRRRSALALSAGVVGIVALVLLVVSPLAYVALALVAEMVGEVVTYLLIFADIFLLAFGGAAAVLLGITALVRLGRSRDRQVGHGWAITGLCTGPLPMLVGGLGLLAAGPALLGEFASSSSPCPPMYVADAPHSPPVASPAIWQPSPGDSPSPVAPPANAIPDATPPVAPLPLSLPAAVPPASAAAPVEEPASVPVSPPAEEGPKL